MTRRRTPGWMGCLAVALFAMTTATTTAMAAQLLPFDHADEDPSLVEFRDRLIATAESRDFEGLTALMSPDIQLSFGGHYGIAEAEKLFSEIPDLWDTLLRVLRNGGGFTSIDNGQRIFVAPYTYFADPPKGAGPYETVILTAADVPVHEAPASDSAVMVRYSYEILSAGSNQELDSQGWRSVALPDGRAGFVQERFMATGVDHRAGFEKENGKWRMFFFLKGD